MTRVRHSSAQGDAAWGMWGPSSWEPGLERHIRETFADLFQEGAIFATSPQPVRAVPTQATSL